MPTYDFISKTITEANVKSIIKTAGYNPSDYIYEPRISRDGYTATGEVVMSVTRLEQAAKKLGIRVEIYSANVALAENGASSSLRSASADLEAGTLYQVNISMSSETVQALIKHNYNLYGFKAVQSSIGGGAPLVWFKTQDFSVETVIEWEKQYEAYTSKDVIIPNGRIRSSFSASINLGQTLLVEAGGIGQVVNGGQPQAISIQNNTSVSFTCGISQRQEGVASPICAFPLFGNNLDVIAPIEKVLFMFSTTPVNTGTVIEQAYGPGILIDMTSDNQRYVEYDINQGWSWGGYSWAQQVPPSSNLVPLLIEQTAKVFRRAALGS